MAVELAELIGQLRAELTKAMHSGQEEELRFEVGPVELKLTVAVQRDGAVGAKVKFWVVELGSDVKVSAASTQRIKLMLDPRRAGQPDRRPAISGAASVGESDDD